MSGFDPAGIRSSPTTAMGTMNRLISIRYSGKAQLARARCPSSSFSTTITWNMRGRVMTATAARKISPVQRPGSTCQAASSAASIRSMIWPTPPAMPQTTKDPTAKSATSLTTASTAMAVTMPWCCSRASRFRVPNRMVNSARPTAIQIAVRPASGGAWPSGVALAKTPKDRTTDCSCSAI